MMKETKKTISKNGCRSNSISTAKRRREYLPLIFTPLTIECDNTILTGSVMDQKIMVQKVEVTEFQPGFDTPNHDFEVTFE